MVAQMIADEASHAEMAQKLGGAELPQPLQLAMQVSSKVMTQTSRWV